LVDRAGNESVPRELRIVVKPVPKPVERQNLNRLEGLVLFYEHPLKGMTVFLEGPEFRQTQSDEKGYFRFLDLPPGNYRVVARGRFDSGREGPMETRVTVPPPPNKLPLLKIDFQFYRRR
jgi:hypothetical protein